MPAAYEPGFCGSRIATTIVAARAHKAGLADIVRTLTAGDYTGFPADTIFSQQKATSKQACCIRASRASEATQELNKIRL